MINQALLAKLTAPDYGPAVHGFTPHLDPPPEDKIVFYLKRFAIPGEQEQRSTRPTIPWDAFDKVDAEGKKICRIKGCGQRCPGGAWKSCSHKHSALFEQEVRYYDWDMTRYDVKLRDGRRCVLCGMTAEKHYRQNPGDAYRRTYWETQCDHIIPWAYVLLKFPDMPIVEKIHRFYLNRENLRTLCAPCHRDVTAHFLAYLPRVRRGADYTITPLEEFLK